MGRSLDLKKLNTEHLCGNAKRRALQAFLAMACVAPGCLNSVVLGQLRTGRDASRDYYPQNSSAQIPRPSDSLPRTPHGTSERKPVKRPARSLESISEDPPAEDLPQWAAPGQADSLANAIGPSPKKPVGLEVAPATFETSAASNSVSSNRAVSLATHQAATKQTPSSAAGVIKRVTPSRVVLDQVTYSERPSNRQEDATSVVGSSSSLETQGERSDTYQSELPMDGYVLDDPTLYREDHLGVQESCGDPYCADCGPSYPTLNIRIGFPPLLRCDRITARVEAATFWPTSQSLPGLVRTAEIGIPGSVDLFGGTQDLDQSVQGVRGEFGYRVGSGNCNTLQFRFFDAGAQSLTLDSPSSSATSIVRPYQDGSQNPIVQDAVSVKEPGISDGSVLAHAYSDVQGGDVLLKRLWLKNCDATTEWLVGYQNARINDFIDVHSTTIPIGSTNVLELRDQFRAVNQFHGATFGVSRMVYSPRWSLGSMFKLGLGDLQRDVTITGFQKVGNAPASTNGLLARSPANGFYSTSTFVFSPEVNVTIGYRLTQNLEATLGYTYLGLPKVARAGEQIDTVSDLDSANPTRPRFILQESDFSLHSLNYGLQYRY